MTTIFQRTKNIVDITQLKQQLNNSVEFTSTCVEIVHDIEKNLIFIHWNNDLAPLEIEAMDDIISAHDATEEEIPISKFPLSDLDGIKLAVHSSPKPKVDGITTYAVWTGAGDDIENGILGDGQLLEFDLVTGKESDTVVAKFDPQFGRVFIHEGYARFENGGKGDYITAVIKAEATPLQTAANLDLILTENWIKYSPSGPGTGTHGFADLTKIQLIPRSFSKDGDWDYDGTTLTPNLAGNGSYKISDVVKVVHRYNNKIPCRGSSPTYFTMSSDETAELLKNYYIEITAYNKSDTTWYATVLMEIYRERTQVP